MSAVDAAPASQRELLARATNILSAALPPDWSLRVSPRVPLGAGDDEADAVAELVDPDGVLAVLAIQAKRILEARDVARLREKLRNSASARGGDTWIIAARYLSPQVRDRLTKAGLGYVDATGNVRLAMSRPGLFISSAGADRDPWRGPGRPRGSLKGAPAAKVVRALIDIDQTWSVRSLVEASGASTGATYRVVQFLEEEELIDREGPRVSVPSWQDLLRRWSRDYEFVKSSNTSRWIAPRGLERLLTKVAGSNVQYAVTGTLAAAEWAPYAPARSAMIYTSDAPAAAAAWELSPTEAGANVILAEPESDAVFARTRPATGGKHIIAAPSQVAVDLLTGPGRGPSEAEELIDWMSRNERVWRRAR